jgi:hypothetical protein
MKDYAFWIEYVLMNFALSMLVLAGIFVLFHKLIFRRTSQYEIIYRWVALFAVGFSGIFTFFMHVFHPDFTSASIGWTTNPFEFEVGIADFGFGLIAILSFAASYGFRLATVIGNTCWLWGDAIGHFHEMVTHQNYAIGNAGTWLWMDILLPIILIICILKLRPGALVVVTRTYSPPEVR